MLQLHCKGDSLPWQHKQAKCTEYTMKKDAKPSLLYSGGTGVKKKNHKKDLQSRNGNCALGNEFHLFSK